VLAAVVWVPLAWRALTLSVTLTPDKLVIRNILTTDRVPLANIVAVGFHRGQLTVTTAHGAAAPDRLAVSAVNLGSSRWSGLRSDADAVAEAVTRTAGLPPLPPRPIVISRSRARLMFVAAALCLGLGVYSEPLRSGSADQPFLVRVAGLLLLPAGTAMLAHALRITRDHRRNRIKHPAADE
jgi:hypothetical protein